MTLTIRIVTDSTADIPQALAEELGITVVPLYVRFGHEVYRDGVDISGETFYQRLTTDPIHPTTSQPNPQDFAEVYTKLAEEADGIISVHISSKLSGTCSSALQAKQMMDNRCPIEVIDTLSVSMGIGLVATFAARLAASSNDFSSVVKEVKESVPKTHLWALFDTLKYLAMGGRIGKSKALMGSILNIKPILAMKEGELVPATKARSQAKGFDILEDFAKGCHDIQDMSVMYTTTRDEAQSFAERLQPLVKQKQVVTARIGPAIGVHAGPGAMALSVREA